MAQPNITLSEIEEAFRKLSSTIYFDKSNLGLREKLAEFLNKEEDEKDNIFRKLLVDIRSGNFRVEGKIGVRLMPKKIEQIDIPCQDHNFFTNITQRLPSEINRLAYFVEASIEVQLISVLWTMRYGPLLDKDLDACCLGNRLVLDQNDNIPPGRRLFKKYTLQFQEWWSSALEAAQNLLDNNKDATILNLDFKDYYHRVELNFEEIEAYISEQAEDKSILKDKLHLTFKKVHEEYKKALQDRNHQGLQQDQSGLPLPIGLLSSPVLANFYLMDFDLNLNQKLNPTYYGRYVDDILIVIQDTVIDVGGDFKCKEDKEITGERKPELVKHYFDTYLKSVFEYNEDDYRIAFLKDKYNNLMFQKDKLFIYQFDSTLSPDLLRKFENDQKNRVSAFEFLSEDDDKLYLDLDDIVFEENLYKDESSNGRFKTVNENKYELSVFLAKMIRGSVMTGKDFKPEQAKKLTKYFKGHQLIKNFYFWEKLFQFWFIREDYQTFINLYAEIELEIRSLKSKDLDEDELQKCKTSLFEYLGSAFLMTYGLYPLLEFGNYTLTDSQKSILKRFKSKRNLYRKAGLLRKSCIHFPLAQFFKTANGDLTTFPIFKMPFNDTTELQLDVDQNFPYRVKFYEIALFEQFNCLMQYKEVNFAEAKYHEEDFLDTEKILNESWEKFKSINNVSESEAVKSGYFVLPASKKIQKSEIPSLQISLKNGGKTKSGKCRIGIINRYVDFKESEKSLEGQPIVNSERFNEFNQIWDSVNRIKNCDLFVMPEIALPWHMAHYYATISVYKQTGFLTGLEHIKSGVLGFNLTFTCLPITVEDDMDAIPIFRLKNHYSHAEEDWINKKRMVVPKPKPFRYNLFKWRDLYFSEYNCFELANVKHRNLFYGKIDMLFSPIWNKDMHYYNSLVESTTRDMHLPVIMCNTAQYGDSRVTMPFGHIKRDKVRVKGGVVKDYRTTLLVADIDVKQLRYYQSHHYSATKDFNEEHNTNYKPLPPDYPFNEAEKRHELK